MIRRILSFVLIVLGIVAAPLSTLVVTANRFVGDTTAVTEALTPLASDPAFQNFLSDQIVTAITERVDVTGLTDSAVTSVLGESPTALQSSARRLLTGAAADGMTAAIRGGVSAFVRSDRFATLWANAVPIVHRQFLGTLRADPTSLIGLEDTSTVVLRLGPLVDAARQSLLDSGATIAEYIPPIERTLVLGDRADVAAAQSAYELVSRLSPWLPVITVALFLGGIALSHRRRLAVIRSMASLALVLFLSAYAAAAWLLPALSSAIPHEVPSDSLALLGTSIVDPTVRSLLVTGSLAALVTVGAVAMTLRWRASTVV